MLSLVKARGMNYTAEPGEAAFYGPKIDFVVRDCIGREWQLGTVQLDYNLPEALRAGVHRRRQPHASAGDDPSGAVRLDGALHGHPDRALRRRLPAVAGAGTGAGGCRSASASCDYGKKVEAELRSHGFRVSGDYRPEKIGYKIREAQMEKIPYMLVVGEKEQSAGTVAVRDRVDGDLGALPLAEVVQRLTEEVREKRIRQTAGERPA